MKGDVFTRNIISYNIESLDKLFAVVNYVFQQCLFQLENSEKNLSNLVFYGERSL
ncbi:hypothetical protein [Dapis sp. BLCC M229]|uniref:hypothetical protein n=1 Tax=Dapis sp. BLCC M229 TaxID=3400188 RepID=UPI003CE9EB36